MVMDNATPSTIPFYAPDPLLETARLKIADHLGLPDTDGLKHVTIARGRPKTPDGNYVPHGRHHYPDGVETDELIVTIHKGRNGDTPGLDLGGKGAVNELRAKLGQFEGFDSTHQMVPIEKVAVKVHDDIEKIADSIPAPKNKGLKELLKWKGFDPKVVDEGFEIGDYALQNIRSSSRFGLRINMHAGHAKGETGQEQAISNFKTITENRIADVRAILTQRIQKYAEKNLRIKGLDKQTEQEVIKKAQDEGKNEAEVKQAVADALTASIDQVKKQIAEDVQNLLIEINTDHSNLVITIRSKDQQAAFDHPDNKAIRDDYYRDNYYQDLNPDDKLANSNPLTSTVYKLTTEETPATETERAQVAQQQATLARAFLFNSNKEIIPDALMFFGSRDMKSALIKEFMLRVVKDHPEKLEEIEKIINSELFKDHGKWHTVPGTDGSVKPEPKITRVAGNNDTVEFAFTLRTDEKNNQMESVVKSIAEGKLVSQTSTETQTSPTMQAMADQAIAAGSQPPTDNLQPAPEAVQSNLQNRLQSLLKGPTNPAELVAAPAASKADTIAQNRAAEQQLSLAP